MQLKSVIAEENNVRHLQVNNLTSDNHLGPLLLTWFNFDPNMDK